MKIRTKREFSGIPMGTTGEAVRDGTLWKITWDLTHHADGSKRYKPLVDWFSQEDFELYLEAV
jgi:hypothetical protein